MTPPSSMSSPFDPTGVQNSSGGSSVIGTPSSNSNNIIQQMIPSNGRSSSNSNSNGFSNLGSCSSSGCSPSGSSTSYGAGLSLASSNTHSSQPWSEIINSPHRQSQAPAIASVLHESAAAAKAAAANGQQPMANVDIIRRNLWLMIVRKEILPAHRRRQNFRHEKFQKTKTAAHRCVSQFNGHFRKQFKTNNINNQNQIHGRPYKLVQNHNNNNYQHQHHFSSSSSSNSTKRSQQSIAQESCAMMAQSEGGPSGAKRKAPAQMLQAQMIDSTPSHSTQVIQETFIRTQCLAHDSTGTK